MQAINILLLIIAAFPIFCNAAPRPITATTCQIIYPTFMQLLNETNQTYVGDNLISSDSQFLVSQRADRSNSTLMVVAFQGVPTGSYGCSLSLAIANTTLQSSSQVAMDVKTLYNGNPDAITFPNNWSYQSLYQLDNNSIGSGVFGTVTPRSGVTSIINSQTCATNLAYIFEISAYVKDASAVEFKQYVNKLNSKGFSGLYLTYDC